jgi:hypothetical protein
MSDLDSPARFPHYPEYVPEELKTDETWLCCDEQKVPLVASVNGACYAASSTDPNTWRTYDEAYTAWLENEWSYAGVGRVIRAGEDLVGVDLDDCLNPDTGELTPWATSILERLDSYAEISPSGTGVKVWVKAPGLKRAHVKPGLETYPRGRYFTVIGVILIDRPIAVRDAEIAAIVDEEFPRVDRDRSPYDGPKRVLDLLDFLERANIEIFAELSDGQAERKYAVRCPWLDEHTGGDESGTYAGQYADGATFFQCWHSHCSSRGWQEFKAFANAVITGGRPRRLSGRFR